MEMLRKTLFLTLAAVLVTLAMSPKAQAWYHYSYHTNGYGGGGYHYSYHYGGYGGYGGYAGRPYYGYYGRY
jgi:hypothetical protein